MMVYCCQHLFVERFSIFGVKYPITLYKPIICNDYLDSIIIVLIMERELKEFLLKRKKKSIVDDKRVSSAVLLPIYYKENQCHILFTKRTDNVKEHKGQISFPGGAFEPADETLANTALRESAEEIGLVADRVEILGELDDTRTLTSNYVVSPFVGLISEPHEFKADGWEAERIIEVPVPALMDRNSLHEETELINGRAIEVYYYNYKGNIIWGATARILHQFLEILAQLRQAA